MGTRMSSNGSTSVSHSWSTLDKLTKIREKFLKLINFSYLTNLKISFSFLNFVFIIYLVNQVSSPKHFAVHSI